HSQLRVLSEEDRSIAEIMERLNQYICDSVEYGQFITMFYGRLEVATGRLEYVNAGHDAPYLFDASGQLHLLEANNKLIGIDPHARYPSDQAQLEPGSLFVLYTDGYVEATNAAGEYFGDTFMATLREMRNESSVRQIRRSINRELLRF